MIEELYALDKRGGDEFVVEILQHFADSAPKQIALMRQSLESGAVNELKIAAHTLRASSGQVGARAIWKLSKTLEQLASESELDRARDAFEKLDALFGTTMTALNAARELIAKTRLTRDSMA